jgi:hypothetical protein
MGYLHAPAALHIVRTGSKLDGPQTWSGLCNKEICHGTNHTGPLYWLEAEQVRKQFWAQRTSAVLKNTATETGNGPCETVGATVQLVSNVGVEVTEAQLEKLRWSCIVLFSLNRLRKKDRLIAVNQPSSQRTCSLIANTPPPPHNLLAEVNSAGLRFFFFQSRFFSM